MIVLKRDSGSEIRSNIRLIIEERLRNWKFPEAEDILTSNKNRKGFLILRINQEQQEQSSIDSLPLTLSLYLSR